MPISYDWSGYKGSANGRPGVEDDAAMLHREISKPFPRGALVERQIEDAQFRLIEELGRRYGWTRYESGRRSAHRITGRQPRRDLYFDVMPNADHSGAYFKKGGHIAALVEQPYADHADWPEMLAEIEAWAKSRNVKVHAPDFPSWHFPSATKLILITKLDVMPLFTPSTLNSPHRLDSKAAV